MTRRILRAAALCAAVIGCGKAIHRAEIPAKTEGAPVDAAAKVPDDAERASRFVARTGFQQPLEEKRPAVRTAETDTSAGKKSSEDRSLRNPDELKVIRGLVTIRDVPGVGLVVRGSKSDVQRALGVLRNQQKTLRFSTDRDGQLIVHGSEGQKKQVKELIRKLQGKSPKTWKRAQIVPNASRLKVGDNEELPLKGMQVNVQVDGFRARVTLDCFFLNDKARQLEGTFQIRLPVGASLDFFAFGETKYQAPKPKLKDNAFLDPVRARKNGHTAKSILSLRESSWNAPKVARVVPREKASFAYRQTVRRRVDPALAEWAGAGVFNARVFPLAAGKLHRVVVGYDVNLLRAGATPKRVRSLQPGSNRGSRRWRRRGRRGPCSSSTYRSVPTPSGSTSG